MIKSNYFLICVCIILLFSFCSVKNGEKKIKNIVIEYVNENFNDPSTFEYIKSFKPDSLFEDYSTNLFSSVIMADTTASPYDENQKKLSVDFLNSSNENGHAFRQKLYIFLASNYEYFYISEKEFYNKLQTEDGYPDKIYSFIDSAIGSLKINQLDFKNRVVKKPKWIGYVNKIRYRDVDEEKNKKIYEALLLYDFRYNIIDFKILH